MKIFRKKLDTIVPKFDEYLRELLKIRAAAEKPAWLLDSHNDYEQNELIQELNQLDEQFYAIIDRKTFLDPACLVVADERKIKKSATSTAEGLLLSGAEEEGVNNVIDSDMIETSHHALGGGVGNDNEGTLMAVTNDVNWLDNVSDEAMMNNGNEGNLRYKKKKHETYLTNFIILNSFSIR